MNDPARRWNMKRWSAYLALEQDRQREIAADERRIVDERKAVKKARGLSKNSWYQIGTGLRLSLRGVPAYVANASPSNGQHYVNGSGSEHSESSKFYLQFENRYPALASPRTAKMNGHKILQRAVDTRLKAFEIEMQKGVFQDMKARAQRHPGVFVTP